MLADLLCLLFGHRPAKLIIEVRTVADWIWIKQCPRCKTIDTGS